MLLNILRKLDILIFHKFKKMGFYYFFFFWYYFMEKKIKTDVAVAGDAVPVHQHGNTPLVAFGIEVVECHDVHSVLVEIAGGVDVEILGSQPRSAQQRGERER